MFILDLHVEKNTFQLIGRDVMVAKYFENESCTHTAVDAFQFFVSSSARALTIFPPGALTF
jgi:hypothetical protein